MSWYLTLTPAAGQPLVAETRPLVEFLAALPELRQTGPIAFIISSFFTPLWQAFVLTARDILGGSNGQRGAFRDAKQESGVGGQQVRRVMRRVGGYHVALWAQTLTWL